jgi:nitrogen fixation NifU-like protein
VDNMDRGAGAIDALYRDVIMDHQRNPRNFGTLEGADATVEGYNPLCGDRVDIGVKLEDGKLKACSFKGEGCAICMASASMMTEELTGRPISEVEEAVTGFRAMMRGEECPFVVEGDLESLVGVRKFSVRVKCALLPWTTLGDALKQAQGGAP